MNCRRLSHNAAPAGRWHRLRCASCRAARSADAMIAREVLQMRLEPAPSGGQSRTLAALRAVETAGGQGRSRLWRLRTRPALPAVGLGLLGLSALWWHDMNADPNVVIPTQTAPPRNAFDFYRAAGLAIKDGEKVTEAIGPETRSPSRSAHRYTPAEREALVQENADALKLLRVGSAYPYQESYVRSYRTLFPHYATYRELARLLKLEAQTSAARGDWRGAVRSDLDAVQLGTEIPHGAALIGKLVGIACQSTGRVDAWNAVDHLNAAPARAAAQRLETLAARRVPLAATLQEEKWNGQSTLMELFQRPDWGGAMASEVNGPSRMEDIAFRIRVLFDSKRKIMDNYTRYMDALIANTQRPYAARRPDPPLPGDYINRMLLPIYSQAWYLDVFNETQNALLRLALALRAYRLEHRAYPDTLSALVPGYLKTVPLDPFASGVREAPRYRREGETYRLYSVGPDGRDDNGRPVETMTGMPRRQVSAESVGDIVAGVNR